MANLIITIFFGWSGYARFRKGQAGLGVLWLFTGGCLLVGWIIDIVDAVKEMNGTSTPKAVSVDTSDENAVKNFHTKIAGVTYKNDDGSDRQLYIKNLKVGQSLVLKHTPSSEYPNAVAVFTEDGKQLGYLKESVAAEMVQCFGNNPMSVTVSSVTGGGDYNYGCNIHVKAFNNP
jgi:hypothetical protein